MRRITVRTARGEVYTFEEDPRLRTLDVGNEIYFIDVPDASSPSGRKAVWQQRVENGEAEGFEITVSED
jgi:hypothetical protein